jgi:hypothetical protein
MGFVSDIIPINYNEEKAKFFADNFYNPQFEYKIEIPKKKFLQHGGTSKKYEKLAENILEKTYFGRNDKDLEMMEGRKVSQAEAEKTIKTFLHMYGLHKRFQVRWSSSFVARTSITHNTIKLRLPCEFRKESLMGMLYHEVGTHAVRRINHEKQPWYGDSKKYGFTNYLKTEEGLAILHSLIPRSYKSAHNAAIRYLAVAKAQSSSFVEVWNSLGKYIQDPDKRWRVAYREKRGIEDTSQPGGYSKDLVYFEGMVDVYRWLLKNDFNIEKLYFGKIAMEEVDKVFSLNPNFKPELPLFFSLDRNKYMEEIKKIGEVNEL